MQSANTGNKKDQAWHAVHVVLPQHYHSSQHQDSQSYLHCRLPARMFDFGAFVLQGQRYLYRSKYYPAARRSGTAMALCVLLAAIAP